MNIKKYDANISKFKTWLTGITINKILMHKRRNSYINYDFDIEIKEDLMNTDHYHIESNIDFKKLIFIIQKMPEKYRVIFNLNIIDGFTHKEIAEQLDISVSSSRVILHRGREWAMNEILKLQSEPFELSKK